MLISSFSWLNLKIITAKKIDCAQSLTPQHENIYANLFNDKQLIKMIYANVATAFITA